MTGIERIAAERRRQIEVEGWTPAHDNQYVAGELANAAACYVLPDARRDYWCPRPASGDRIPAAWPWTAEWWKPTPEDRVRELTKAGALIAAEIDRLTRATGRPTP